MKTSRLSVSKILRHTLVYAWKASPAVFSFLIAASVLFCMIRVLEVYALRYFFDAIAGLAGGRATTADTLRTGLPVAVLLLLGPLSEIAEYLAQGYFWRRGSGYLLSLFHQRTGRLGLVEFETTQVFDEMQKARFASEGAPAAARSMVQFLFYYAPFFGFTSVYLFAMEPMLVWAIFFIFGSVLLSQLIRAQAVYRFQSRNAGLRRQTEYFESCITANAFFKETRTLGVFAYFYGAFLDSTKRYGEAFMRMERKTALVEAGLRLVNALGYVGVLGLLLYYVNEGTITVGAFASVFYSIDRISDILKNMVEHVGEAVENISTSSFFFRFLQEKEDGLRDEPLNKAADIRLRDVSFAYPGGESVLRGICLDIKHGETLAIVGENGAGKTTLTKLITGLYRPTEGTVWVGDKDLHAYKPNRRFQSVSAVFQSFVRYKMSLCENIRVSEMDSDASVHKVIEKAGVSMEELSGGLDTMLSREYGGTELSGGQWQRVAIARGFYRMYDIIILDEPTAAIDPIEESNVFRLFKESARGKTAVLVTHRLGSAKIADTIVVMENGRIVEEGSHAELMALGGKYSSMFAEQAKWYERPPARLSRV